MSLSLEICLGPEGSGDEHGPEELNDWSVATTLVHGSSGIKVGGRVWKGTSSIVSSSEGMVVICGGADGDKVGCTGTEGAAGATGKGSSSLPW